jgi:DNA invertase Pin-like site-specific DNA recombinase
VVRVNKLAEAIRTRGRRGGRPKKLDAQQRELAINPYKQKKHRIDEICRSLGISKPTLYAGISEPEGQPSEQ